MKDQLGNAHMLCFIEIIITITFLLYGVAVCKSLFEIRQIILNV